MSHPVRRQSDDDDDQGWRNRSNGLNGWALPSYAKVGIVGVLCFLLLFFAGAMPFLPSPIHALQQALTEHTQSSALLLRAICREIAEQGRRPTPPECR